MREALPDFAPLLWHSFGTVASLLQEITAVYPYINPPNLTVRSSQTNILYLKYISLLNYLAFYLRLGLALYTLSYYYT